MKEDQKMTKVKKWGKKKTLVEGKNVWIFSLLFFEWKDNLTLQNQNQIYIKSTNWMTNMDWWGSPMASFSVLIASMA